MVPRGQVSIDSFVVVIRKEHSVTKAFVILIGLALTLQIHLRGTEFFQAMEQVYNCIYLAAQVCFSAFPIKWY